jgi:hypothetical protein
MLELRESPLKSFITGGEIALAKWISRLNFRISPYAPENKISFHIEIGAYLQTGADPDIIENVAEGIMAPLPATNDEQPLAGRQKADKVKQYPENCLVFWKID